MVKAVIADIPSNWLQERRRTGADRWDEIWNGVWHMPPMPNRAHQELEGALETWLRLFWARPRGNRVYHQINLAVPGGWPDKDYRIPDLVLLTPDRFSIDHNEYFEGAPTVVVEIRSPGDETYEKFEFYERLQLPEIWVIDRDNRTPELHTLDQKVYQQARANPDGWLQSRATGVDLRETDTQQLLLRLTGDDSTCSRIPDAD
jgi:Uma2 family endonuclease